MHVDDAGAAQGTADGPSGSGLGRLCSLTIINAAGTHEGPIQAAVTAALAVLSRHRDRPQWDQWMAGPRECLVRLAGGVAYRQLESITAHASVSDGLDSALSWIPMHTYNIPRAAALLAESSATLAKRRRWPDIPAGSAVALVIADTGGTARAASHAVSAVLQWQLAQPRLTSAVPYVRERPPMPVIGVGAQRFRRLVADSLHVRDASRLAFVANADLIRRG